MLPLLTVVLGKSRNGVVALSGESVVDIKVDPTNATSGIRVNTDGTVDKQVAASYSQIDSATDWVIPNHLANTSYEVRITSVVWNQSGDGETFSPEWAVAGTWKAVTADAEWGIVQAVVGIKDVTFTLEIRQGSGATIDTASYTLNADVAAL